MTRTINLLNYTDIRVGKALYYTDRGKLVEVMWGEREELDEAYRSASDIEEFKTARVRSSPIKSRKVLKSIVEQWLERKTDPAIHRISPH